MAGNCPKCGKMVTAVNMHPVTAREIGGNEWKAITYQRVMCSTVLGCQINPVLLKNDIVREVLTKLR